MALHCPELNKASCGKHSAQQCRALTMMEQVLTLVRSCRKVKEKQSGAYHLESQRQSFLEPEESDSQEEKGLETILQWAAKASVHVCAHERIIQGQLVLTGK